MGQLLTVIALGSLPAPGLPASAIDALATVRGPARMTKANGYTAIEYGFRSDAINSGDYALYSYWPVDKDWKPEGPRGATPTTIDAATVAGRTPVKVSLLEVEREVCVVLCAGAGVVGPDSGLIPVAVEAQIR